jgi:hypothetical protein
MILTLQIQMASQSDSLGISDSMEVCSEEELESDDNPKKANLHDLTSDQMNCLDPFR